jgi:hypothetical protein
MMALLGKTKLSARGAIARGALENPRP